jgi:hypothetical protein
VSLTDITAGYPHNSEPIAVAAGEGSAVAAQQFSCKRACVGTFTAIAAIRSAGVLAGVLTARLPGPTGRGELAVIILLPVLLIPPGGIRASAEYRLYGQQTGAGARRASADKFLVGDRTGRRSDNPFSARSASFSACGKGPPELAGSGSLVRPRHPCLGRFGIDGMAASLAAAQFINLATLISFCVILLKMPLHLFWAFRPANLGELTISAHLLLDGVLS